jgi:hypothetical protein
MKRGEDLADPAPFFFGTDVVVYWPLDNVRMTFVSLP